ncbi:MAG: potassium uptake protein [Erysipelotrichaceae bacterium]|nr:potassium uptake protein [Erysipelotrichaceae bacterium]
MKVKFKFTTTQLILLSFLIAIVAGSLLLMLPISSATGQSVAYVDALFTATTAVCVTGLVTLPTVSSWSVFGQIIILILIQIGGLGIITIMSGLMISLHKKMGMRERVLIQDAFNLNTMSGMIRFIKKVLIGTFVVEGIGALLYMLVFVPEFGLRGIWVSVFNSISAFCNAGIDILSENSLLNYGTHPLVLSVTNSLISLGGIGYIVWWDVLRVLKEFRAKKMRCFCGLTLHSKIALSMTAFLLASGTILFFIFEYSNPLTMMDYSLFDKVQASFFQSVTTRTAGFATFPQENLTNASAFVSLLLMFIGGSPVGTAGGVKTVTIAVLIYAAFATIKNEEDVVLFDRTIAKKTISKSVAVVFVSFMIMCISTVLLSSVTDAQMLDILYETVSATATVGLTRNLTSSLNLWGKLIVIVTMYFGRVGPISMIVAFNTTKDKKNIIKNPTEEISVG